MKKKQQIGVVAVIEKDGKILLVKRDTKRKYFPGKWCLPGGAVEFGESPLEALNRELQEEINISNISPKDLLCLHTRIYTIKDEKKHVVLLFFSTEIKGEPSVGQEVDDVQWIDQSEFDDFDILEGDREILNEFMK